MEDVQEDAQNLCVFVEDAQEDAKTIVFLWKTLEGLRDKIKHYILYCNERLPQKHIGFNIFLCVFHKNI